MKKNTRKVTAVKIKKIKMPVVSMTCQRPSNCH